MPGAGLIPALSFWSAALRGSEPSGAGDAQVTVLLQATPLAPGPSLKAANGLLLPS